MRDIPAYFETVKETREGFRTCCPMCEDTENKLYWNTEKGVGCCFHHDCAWFKERGGVTEYRLRSFLEKKGIDIVIPTVVRQAEDAEVALPEEFQPLHSSRSREKDKIYAYLESRGLNRKIIDKANVGYCDEGKMWGYIVFPVYNVGGEVVYWQGRRFKNRKAKFFNPVSSFKSDLVYQIRHRPQARYMIVVESIINVLTLESGLNRKNVVVLATLGKSVTDYQRDRVLAYEKSLKKIWIAFDPDAMSDALVLADRLGTLGPRIQIAKFPEGGDVNSVGFKRAWRLISRAREYTGRNRMSFLHG